MAACAAWYSEVSACSCRRTASRASTSAARAASTLLCYTCSMLIVAGPFMPPAKFPQCLSPGCSSIARQRAMTCFRRKAALSAQMHRAIPAYLLLTAGPNVVQVGQEGAPLHNLVYLHPRHACKRTKQSLDCACSCWAPILQDGEQEAQHLSA